jgi:hypothetical protein
MWSFQKKDAVLKPKIGTKELRMHWDDNNAKYYYFLYEYTFVHISCGDYRDRWRCVANGGLAWAKKTAKHYDIPLPTQVTERPWYLL